MMKPTVNDMVKKTGYIMSPDNPFAKSMADAAAPEESAEQTPPGLRDRMAEAQICGTCEHFEGNTCAKFGGYPCKFHEGCDEHSQSGAEDEEEMDSEAEPMMAEEVE